MKFDLRRIFAGGGSETATSGFEDAADTDYLPVNGEGEGLETEYQSLIAAQLRRWGVSNQCITVEVRRVGQGADGYDVFAGMLRLVRWDRDSTLRVMLGLPLLEAKIRKTVRATWLADYSHFAGLWLHASERMKAPGELRELLAAVAPLPGHPASPGGNLHGNCFPSSTDSDHSRP